MAENFGDRTTSALLEGLSGFWQRFFKDTKDIAAFYEASTQYLGQVYLDLLSAVLNLGLVDTPIFNTEIWKLFAITEQDLLYREGSVAINDRYIYDMPGTIVDVNVLQNSIFNPQILYEKNLHYDIDLDGYIKFYSNLFHAYSENGVKYPERGVAWRTVNEAVGNSLVSLSDALRQIKTNYTDLGVRIGDSIRFITNAHTLIGERQTGQIVVGSTSVDLTWVNSESPPLLAGTCKTGDVVQVYAAENNLFLGFYAVESVGPGDTCLRLSSKTVGLPTISSTAPLKFKIFRAALTNNLSDYTVAQIDDATGALIARSTTPLPYPTEGLTTFRVVRDPADNLILHESVGMNNTSSSYPVVKKLTQENIAVTSFTVVANKVGGGLVVEGEDYSVDYVYGIFYQLQPWHPVSLGVCTYTYKKTVITVAAGTVQAKDVSPMRQVSLWAPRVEVDRFTLWYNFGSLVNRFEASSDAYKKFLRGIFHLYVSGPVFARIESALNLILHYPLASTDGERLLSYDSGIVCTGSTASLLVDENYLQVDPAEYVFTDNDVGSTVRFLSATNAVNRGSFKISARTTLGNIVILASEFPLCPETNLQWELSPYATQTLLTDLAEYQFPLTAPIKQKLLSALGAGNNPVLSAFDAFTDAFTVTDYVEDPTWWHNKEIPTFLWENSYGNRRFASAQLYAHILDGGDEACVDDPGLYLDAGDDGIVITDLTTPIYRHKVAFILFDTYLKYHMFMVKLHPSIRIDSALQADLDELILITKPSYTYPYVEPGREFEDIMQLVDTCNIANIGFEFGGSSDAYSDTVNVANNQLILDDPKFPWRIDACFRVVSEALTFIIPLDLTQIPGSTIRLYDQLWPGIDSDSLRLLALEISYYPGDPSTWDSWCLGIEPVTAGTPKRRLVEGIDYSVDWLVEVSPGVKNPTYSDLTILTAWNLPKPEWLIPPGTIIFARAWLVLIGDGQTGLQELSVDGLNPFYVRKQALYPTSPTYQSELASRRTEMLEYPIHTQIFEW